MVGAAPRGRPDAGQARGPAPTLALGGVAHRFKPCRLLRLQCPMNFMASFETRRLPQVVAHRGASGYAPETTLASCRLALEMNADFIEIDIQMSRDGEIVAIHDALVDRTTNGTGGVGDMTLAQLKALDAGSWFNSTFPKKARPEYVGEKIPTLLEIIDLAGGSRTGLYLEIKNPELYPPELESKLLAMVRRNQFEKRVRILSFNARSIKKIRALDPSIPAAFLVTSAQIDPIPATLAVYAGELALRYRLLTPEIVRQAHKQGLSVAVWTVNENKALQRAITLQADRIITNYPDRLTRLLFSQV